MGTSATKYTVYTVGGACKAEGSCPGRSTCIVRLPPQCIDGALNPKYNALSCTCPRAAFGILDAPRGVFDGVWQKISPLAVHRTTVPCYATQRNNSTDEVCAARSSCAENGRRCGLEPRVWRTAYRGAACTWHGSATPIKLIMMSRGEALARSACWYCVCVDTHSTYNNLVHRRCGIQHTGELRGNAIDSKRTTGHTTRDPQLFCDQDSPHESRVLVACCPSQFVLD